MRPLLLLDAVLTLITALLYLYVGLVVSKRPTTTPDGTSANRSFAIWWGALAATTLLGALRDLIGAFEVTHRAPHTILTYLTLPILTAALWGLVDYLAYLYTGSKAVRRVVLGIHLLIGAFLFGLIVYLNPVSVELDTWNARTVYEHEMTGPLLGLVIAAILGPVLLASVAYFTLAFRTEDQAARARIFTVSGAFIFWFGGSALGAATGLNAWAYWPIASRAFGIIAALLILYAFKRPRDAAAAATARGPPGLSHELPPRGRLAPAF